MPGYSTHFFVALLIAIPFYHWDEKDRLKTLVVGAFAGIIPDIDGIWEVIIIETGNPTLDYLFSHRGFWHNPILPLLFAITTGVYLLIIILPRREMAKDHFWSLSPIALAWVSHLILDFGFTTTHDVPALIFELPFLAVYVLDQISALVISALLGYILWKRVG
ncbi:MAG: metal-dependent hydrolase [Candidatus Hodarchaeales archaeon]|jgi:membrane-bound metal-dependent hydrolase YbcI (DUF457 family)